MGGFSFRNIALTASLIACCLLVFFARDSGVQFIAPDSFEFVDEESYPYPMHADEWAHISTSIALLEEKKLNFNPYTGGHAQDREKGFHLLLAAIFLIPLASPIVIYKFLAPLMLVINAIFMYLLVRKLTKNDWIGLAAIPFLAAVKSNTNMLGHWYFVPATFTLFLILIYFENLSECVREMEANHAVPLVLLFLLAIFTYPFAAVVMALVSGAMFLLHFNPRKDGSWKTIAVLGAIGILTSAFVIHYFWSGGVFSTIGKFFSELMFRSGWTSLEYKYSVVSLYGIIPFLLAAIGAVVIYKKDKKSLLLAWPFVHLIILAIATAFNISIFIPYQRNLFYFLVSLSPLAATGSYYVFEKIRRVLKKYAKPQANLIAGFAIAILLAATFYHYYTVEPDFFGPHRILTEDEHSALLWLKENAKPYQKTIAEPFLALAVYPVAKQRTLGVIPSSLEGGDAETAKEFYSATCERKKKIIEENKVTFVISRERIGCSYLSQIFQNSGLLIYQTNQVSV